jgi:hypothetical protein
MCGFKRTATTASARSTGSNRGLYGGWVQIASPVSRIAQFKEIETTFGGQNLQQLRRPPTNVADTPDEAPSRLFLLPGARYSDPEFSWKWEVAPGGIGFLGSRALGPQFEGDLFCSWVLTRLCSREGISSASS